MGAGCSICRGIGYHDQDCPNHPSAAPSAELEDRLSHAIDVLTEIAQTSCRSGDKLTCIEAEHREPFICPRCKARMALDFIG